jgi:hypothetical protein
LLRFLILKKFCFNHLGLIFNLYTKRLFKFPSSEE